MSSSSKPEGTVVSSLTVDGFEPVLCEPAGADASTGIGVRCAEGDGAVADVVGFTGGKRSAKSSSRNGSPDEVVPGIPLAAGGRAAVTNTGFAGKPACVGTAGVASLPVSAKVSSRRLSSCMSVNGSGAGVADGIDAKDEGGAVLPPVLTGPGLEIGTWAP